MQLFDLVDLIAEIAITNPQRVRALYENLPEGAREQIDMRDGAPPA